MRRLALPILLLCLCAAGCMDKHWATYDGRRVLQHHFGDDLAAKAEVVRCELVLVNGRYPNGWYEFMHGKQPARVEVVVPPGWIEQACERESFRHETLPQGTTMPTELRPDRGYRPDWYVPGDVAQYDVYRPYLTSLPYRVIYLSRTSLEDGRRRAFIAVK